MRKYIVGIDIGGTSVKIGKFNHFGDLLNKLLIPTNKTDNGGHILKDIVDAVKDMVPVEEIIGIGFGVPGPVRDNIILNCVNLGWNKKNLIEEVHQLIDDDEIIVRVANDATAATAGEMFKGVAKGYESVVMFTLGTGIGGGVIINNNIIDGIDGTAGEIGHIHIDTVHNFKCNCGKTGCLETVASATGIVNVARANMEKYSYPSPLRKVKYLSAKKVFDFAKTGDLIAKESISESMEYLAKAMAMVSYIINPEIIVIGGGVSYAGDYIISEIEKHYYKEVETFISHTHFMLASLGNNAGIYGACYLVKQ